jgi:hypothetical protein
LVACHNLEKNLRFTRNIKASVNIFLDFQIICFGGFKLHLGNAGKSGILGFVTAQASADDLEPLKIGFAGYEN